MRTSKVIWLIMYEGVEWGVPVVAMSDKHKATIRANDLNDKLAKGELDKKEYLFQSLSHFTVRQINLLETA